MSKAPKLSRTDRNLLLQVERNIQIKMDHPSVEVLISEGLVDSSATGCRLTTKGRAAVNRDVADEWMKLLTS